MKSRFTYIGETVIEVVVDGDSLTWNVLPSTVDAPIEQPIAPVSNPEPVVAPPLLGIPATVEPPPTKKKRTLMGFIRAVWFYIFTGAGAVVDYGISQLTDLPIPPGTATIVGGALYGAKRAFWPDTML